MPSTMLLRKLEQVLALTEAERQTIEELPERVLHVGRGEDIINGSRPTSIHLIRTGTPTSCPLFRLNSPD